MIWYQLVVPAVVIALMARLEAIWVGPYWAWIEMFPAGEDPQEDASIREERRSSFFRRVAIPGVVSFVLAAAWPRTYSLTELALVGTAAACLLLWPLVFQGLPYGVSGRRLALLYIALVGAFAASAWFGGHVASFAYAAGGLRHFLEEQGVGMIVSAIVTLFFTTTLTRASSAAARSRR